MIQISWIFSSATTRSISLTYKSQPRSPCFAANKNLSADLYHFKLNQIYDPLPSCFFFVSFASRILAILLKITFNSTCKIYKKIVSVQGGVPLARISHKHSCRAGQPVLPDVKDHLEEKVKLTFPRDGLKADGKTDVQICRTVCEKCGLGGGVRVCRISEILRSQ